MDGGKEPPHGETAQFGILGAEKLLYRNCDSQFIGGTHCQSPSTNDLDLQFLNESSCIWSGYSSVLQLIQSLHYLDTAPILTIQDGRVLRQMILRGVGGWAYAVHVATCVYSNVLASIWYNAIFDASTAQGLQKFSTLWSRERGGNTETIASQIPVVRTNCFVNSSTQFEAVINKTYYPLQPVDGSDTPGGTQLSFNRTVHAANNSQISTIWLTTPDTEEIGTRVIGNNITGMSSAYLNIQIPAFNDSTMGVLASCSIDARWVSANIIGTGGLYETSQVTYAVEDDIGWANPISFPDSGDIIYRSVRLSKDWLQVLTPRLGFGNTSADTWTSLAYMLTEIRVNNSTGFIGSWSDAGVAIQSLVSAVVADGMSRVGYERNGGLTNTTSPPWPLTQDPSDDAYDPILAGTYVLPLAYDWNGSVSDKTEMQWSTTVTGLGYRANSLAYYLALAVLFTHTIIALIHTIWVFRTGETSTAWRSLTELVVLALRSMLLSGETLENASVGIEKYTTLREAVHLRTLGGALQVQGETLPNRASGVHMILGTEYSPSKHGTVVVGERY
ncbi:hypothetical protein G7Y89_g11023 [Cudoniella acicularis]|uniref:Uncharacterized protein n=1 Tax=Cudoniella acicularis TaxID=354080 RepID=A0A8H4RBM9_9HELO|nr:hypothetical protein G7Y89_g11023 [Cudoniella acicularis]